MKYGICYWFEMSHQSTIWRTNCSTTSRVVFRWHMCNSIVDMTSRGCVGLNACPLAFSWVSPITVKSFLTCYCECGPSRASHSLSSEPPCVGVPHPSSNNSREDCPCGPKGGLFSSMFFLNAGSDSVSSRRRLHLKQWCQYIRNNSIFALVQSDDSHFQA